jgi:ParB-like chromosome segregation protein Spo0J
VTEPGLTTPKYQVMPNLSDDALEQLRQSIIEYGVQQPIKKDKQGNILDGFNRQAICDELGIECPSQTVTDRDGEDYTEVEKYELAIELNLARRHLSSNDKRDVVQQLLTAHPELSDRRIANMAHVDHKTVATVRGKAEAGGEIPHHETHIDAKGVQQPATKAAAPKPAIKHASRGASLRQEVSRNTDWERLRQNVSNSKTRTATPQPKAPTRAELIDTATEAIKAAALKLEALNGKRIKWADEPDLYSALGLFNNALGAISREKLTALAGLSQQ